MLFSLSRVSSFEFRDASALHYIPGTNRLHMDLVRALGFATRNSKLATRNYVDQSNLYNLLVGGRLKGACGA